MIKERGDKMSEEIDMLMSRVPVRAPEEEEEMEEGEVEREEGEASSGEEPEKGEVDKGRAERREGRGEHTDRHIEREEGRGEHTDRHIERGEGRGKHGEGRSDHMEESKTDKERRKSRDRHHSESGRKSRKSHDNKENSKDSERKKDKDSRRKSGSKEHKRPQVVDALGARLEDETSEEEEDRTVQGVNGEVPAPKEGHSEGQGSVQGVEGAVEGEAPPVPAEVLPSEVPEIDEPVSTILLPGEQAVKAEEKSSGEEEPQTWAVAGEGGATGGEEPQIKIDSGLGVKGEESFVSGSTAPGEGEGSSAAGASVRVSRLRGRWDQGDPRIVEQGVPGSGAPGWGGQDKSKGGDRGDPRRVMMAAEDEEEEEEMDYQEDMPDE